MLAVTAATIVSAPAMAEPTAASGALAYTGVSNTGVSNARTVSQTAAAAPTTRIVAGAPAMRGATGWFISLQIRSGDQEYLCGGTAISQRWVLTAAHCVADLRDSEIAGSRATVNPADLYRPGRARTSRITRIIVHPGFDSIRNSNDIALVRTSRSLNTTVLPYSADVTTPTAGAALKVFGFGATSSGGFISRVLRVGAVQELSTPEGGCGEYFDFFSPDSMLCAGRQDGRVDACQGDSGGPLTGWAGRRTVVGIVSWGFGCASASFPGVYTRIAAYADWIAANSGVAGSADPLASSAPAQVRAVRPCTTKVCSVSRSGQLRLRVVNLGDEAGQWELRSPKLSVSRDAGSIAGSGTQIVTLRPTTGRRSCTTVSLVAVTPGLDGAAARQAVADYRIALNGANCRGRAKKR